MEECVHGQSAPALVIEGLHDSQAGHGTGRHTCPVCAYAEGKKAGEARNPVPGGQIRECQVGNSAPLSVLINLPDNQGGKGRHKCVICAYHAGLAERIGESSRETELITHGIGIEEFIPDEEGRKSLRLHVQYERSQRNRAKAIELHGTTCKVCGFNFDIVYGEEHADSYIEIHHLSPVSEHGEGPVNPETDLLPLCSNCHSMAHRKTGRTLSVEELKQLLEVCRKTLARCT